MARKMTRKEKKIQKDSETWQAARKIVIDFAARYGWTLATPDDSVFIHADSTTAGFDHIAGQYLMLGNLLGTDGFYDTMKTYNWTYDHGVWSHDAVKQTWSYAEALEHYGKYLEAAPAPDWS